MNREEKVAEVEELKSRFAKSQLTVLTDYKGLDVAAITDLRHKLSKKQSRFKVVKNRLAKIAIQDTPLDSLKDYFVGTTAVSTTEFEVTDLAKIMSDFAKDNEKLKIKVGLLDGNIINDKEIETLANMPSRDQLIAKLMGSMQAPATNLVSVLVQIPRQLVTVLAAIQKQREQA